MAQLKRTDLHAEIDLRFPNNTTELITPPIVRAFLHNLVDSALLVASDKLSLSKSVTLAQARALLTTAPPSVEPGQYYAIAGNWNATAVAGTVYVHGLSTLAYDLQGVLFVGGKYTLVSIDVAAGTAVPVQVDAYTKPETNDLLEEEADLRREADTTLGEWIGSITDLVTVAKTSLVAAVNELFNSLSRKADLVGGYVAAGQIQLASLYQRGLMQIGRGLFDDGNGLVSSGSINWRTRLVPGAGNAITPRHGDYFHFQNDVYVSTAFLSIGDQFAVRHSEFTYPDRYAVVYVDGVAAFPIRPGGLMQLRRQPSGGLDIVFQANSQAVYSSGLVPDALQAAVIACDYDANNTMTSAVPDGSGASMQFFDAAYVYLCFQIGQGVSGLRILNWVRLPKVAGAGSGVTYTAGNGIAIDKDGKISATGTGGTSFTDEQAQDAFAALLAQGAQSGINFTYDDAGNKLNVEVTATSSLPMRDIYAIRDTASVVQAVTRAGNTWTKGDLITFLVNGQLATPPAQGGVADVVPGDTFDALDENNVAWRYTYRRQNDGSLGWTRLKKEV
jgi:hypothetical protein